MKVKMVNDLDGEVVMEYEMPEEDVLEIGLKMIGDRIDGIKRITFRKPDGKVEG